MLLVSGLTKYFGGVAAVKDVTFEVREGEIYALIGPNGAGKTTIFNLITGMLKPDHGTIALSGQRVDGLKPHQIAAAGITRTFQNLQLFSDMTVLENVMTGAHLKDKTGFIKSIFCRPGQSGKEKMINEESLALLSEVGLDSIAEMLAAALPIGQQRLVEISRALVSDPRLIMLDEPAAGLNSTETKHLADYLKKLKAKGLTMILVEHDMETVMEVADRILVINFGSTISEGTPAEVQSDPQVIRAYLGEDEQIA